MKEILNLKNLNLFYYNNDKSKNKAISNFNLKLFENEIVSIIGASGSGKSTIAKFLINLNKDNVKYNFDSYILFNNELSSDLNEINRLRGTSISFVLQESTNALNPTLKIKKQFKIVLKEYYKDITKKEIELKLKEIFEEINIKDYKSVLNKYPYELSGGMNQRINIALALIKKPKILILDEPTSSIDENNKINMLKLIKKIQKKRKICVVFITHDIGLSKKISKRIIVMKNGKIVENVKKIGSKFKFGEEYTKKLIIDSKLNEINNYSINGKVVLEFENVYKKFNNKIVLKDLNFKLKEQECLGIIGPSGCGKSTICKLIIGMYKCDSGKIKFLKDTKTDIIYQDATLALNQRLNIFEILNEERYIKKKKCFEERHILDFFDEFDLDHSVLYRTPIELSGGQKQLILIIRALLNESKLLILDEPTSSLDIITQNKMLKYLKMIKEKYGLTYIIVSHDKNVISYMCNRFISLTPDKLN